jgi:hypothetical protein
LSQGNFKNLIQNSKVINEEFSITEIFFGFNKSNQNNSISKNLNHAMVNHQWFSSKSAIAA